MGKKKPQKKKEPSMAMAMAEASLAGDAQQQRPIHPPQLPSPRKRGRPRKIIARTETEEESEEQPQAQEPVGEGGVEITEGKKRSSKRAKISEAQEAFNSTGQRQLQTKQEEASASTAPDVIKNETLLVDEEAITRKPSPGGRARRKSKPRKSS